MLSEDYFSVTKTRGKNIQILLEIHVLELKKLPEKEQNESGIYPLDAFPGSEKQEGVLRRWQKKYSLYRRSV